MAESSPLYNQFKAAEPFFLLAGPNMIESEENILRMAKHIKDIATKIGLPLVFKSSFDKANRTSSKSFRGPGMAEGLKILEKVKVAYDLPIVTDVHESIQCEAVGKVADIIQIPAFLCRQTDILVAAAQTGKINNIKKGQFCAPSKRRRNQTFLDFPLPDLTVAHQNVSSERNNILLDNTVVMKKLNHNASERDRCKKINAMISSLRSCLPATDQSKLSVSATVSQALKYIYTMAARTSQEAYKGERRTLVSNLGSKRPRLHRPKR